MRPAAMILFLAACGQPGAPAAREDAQPASSAKVDSSTTWVGQGSDTNEWYGGAVAIADLNGDGYGDTVVGAPDYDVGQTSEGRILVYMGSAAGPDAVASLDWESDQSYAALGSSVAGAGDVDLDGYDDLVVGARSSSSGSTAGRAWLLYGGVSGVSDTNADYVGPTTDKDAYFGAAVDGAGDVNGDGYADIIAGAYGYDVSSSNEGAAYVYAGTITGLSTDPLWTLEGSESGANLGYAVAGLGDLNNDGYDDILVGAPNADGIGTNSGQVYLYLGTSTGPATTATWTGDGEAAGDGFGQSIAALGDLNGDGYADFAVGAPDYDVSTSGAEGAVYIYLGNSSGSPTLSQRLDGATADASFGSSVSGGQDFDGDGYTDLLIGSPSYDDGYTLQGAAFAHYGTISGFSSAAYWSTTPTHTYAYGGASVAMGDVDADGLADALVGVPGANVSSSGHEGEAWYFLGISADADGDGYQDLIFGGTDCDDEDPTSYPGATELCDGVDNDCSGALPADETDDDEDGYVECTIDSGGWLAGDSVVGGDDCDDGDGDVNPAGVERCNDTDDDCDGAIDEDAVDQSSWYSDSDGDGYGDEEASALKACDDPGDGYSSSRNDCDDGDASVHPNADEVCHDNVDNDCDGDVDDSSAVDATTWYYDGDGDGYGQDSDDRTACDQPDGFEAQGGDCDDESPEVHPGADEVCDDLDNDCNGAVDDDPVDAETYFNDHDGDGYGSGDGTRFCEDPGEGWATNDGDCDERDPAIHPDAVEEDDYDGLDQDCDDAIEQVYVTGGSPWGCSTAAAPLRLGWILLLMAPLARRRQA